MENLLIWKTIYNFYQIKQLLIQGGFMQCNRIPFLSKIFLPVIFLISLVFSITLSTDIIYSNISVNVNPILYGNTVFYEDFALGTYRFYSVDLTSKVRTELRNNVSSYIWPYDFGGSYAGWITSSGGGGGGGGGGGSGSGGATYKVQILNTTSKVTTDIMSDAAYKDFMAMDSQFIVWTDFKHTTASDTFNEVYISALNVVNPVRISNTISYKANGDIQGNKIVWQDYRNAKLVNKNADIYLYDRTTSVERCICSNAGYQDQPSVYGTMVVWQDYRNAGSNPQNADIYMYDLNQNKETAVCIASGYQANPQIDGNYIVWQDYRNKSTQDTSNADIYLYEISTGKEYPVVTKSGYQGPPSIYGTKIVWFDYTDKKIYAATISGGSSGVSIKYKPLRHQNISVMRQFTLQGRPVNSAMKLSNLRQLFVNKHSF